MALFKAGTRDFSVLQSAQICYGAYAPSYSTGTDGSFAGLQHATDRSQPLSAYVKNECSYIATSPYAFNTCIWTILPVWNTHNGSMGLFSWKAAWCEQLKVPECVCLWKHPSTGTYTCLTSPVSSGSSKWACLISLKWVTKENQEIAVQWLANGISTQHILTSKFCIIKCI